jgi:isopenicillin N synthase-like dioxygenase
MQRALRRLYSVDSHRATNISAVPVIDFSPFTRPDATPDEKARVATDVFRAFRDIGFATLVNHGVPATLISSAFASSALFFSLPTASKEKYNWLSATSNRGYLGMGKEKLAYGKADLKETFEIGNEAEVSRKHRLARNAHAYMPCVRTVPATRRPGCVPCKVQQRHILFCWLQAATSSELKNRWPTELPDFRATMLAYFSAADALHLDVLRCVAVGLGLTQVAWWRVSVFRRRI